MTAYAKSSPTLPRCAPSTGGAAATNSSTLTQLVLEHDALSRWLNLPYAEKWADQFAEKSARIAIVWQEIQKRKAGLSEQREKVG